MNEINWKAKLSSRKFWIAIAAVIIAIISACGINDITSEQVATIVSSIGALIAYIIGETAVDISKNKNIKNNESEEI